MENLKTIDIFVTNLPRDVSETALRNLFSSIGQVKKLKLLDDKKFPNKKLCYVGYQTIDEAVKAVGIADKSTAFGMPMRAVVSKQSLENLESSSTNSSLKNTATNNHNSFSRKGNGKEVMNWSMGSDESKREFLNVDKSVILTDANIRQMEMLNVEIIDMQNVDFIYARILKYTINSKDEIQNLLNKVNSFAKNLRAVRNPQIGESYLAKWDDEYFYRAELLEVLSNGSYRITFVDEGTTNDIVSEIRQIPDGPLMQYPKQFTKVSIGLQQTNEKLKDFIIKKAEDKSPHIYWLGHKINETPVVNLFLDDDEVLNIFQINYANINLHFYMNLYVKFDDIPDYEVNTEFTEVLMNQNQFISNLNFSVQVNEPVKYVITYRNNLKLLPSYGDLCIYEHKTNAKLIPKRCMVKKRHRLTCDIELIDYSQEIKDVSIEDLYRIEPRNDHLVSPPASINCELDSDCNLGNEKLTDLLVSANVRLVIKKKVGANKYRVFLEKNQQTEIPEQNLDSLVGKSYPVFISHMVSPVNFYIQLNKAEYMDRLADIHYKINVGVKGSGKYKSLNELQIGQAVIAPYSSNSREAGDNFRATILEKRSPDEVKVFFVDYGNDTWLKIDKLLDLDEKLISEPSYCIKCSLNLTVRTEAYASAFEVFNELTNFSEGGCELGMEVLECHEKKLIVELTSHTRGVLSTILVNQRLCIKMESPRNLVYNDDLEIKMATRNKTTDKIDRNWLINKLLDLESRVDDLEKALFFY